MGLPDQPAGRAADRYTLLGDDPCRDQADPLGFDDIADALAGLILGSRDSSPFVLGIEADWGFGKSTLMRKLERKLVDAGKKTVWFNAWTAGGTSVLEGLVKSVLDQMDKNVLRKALRNRKLMGWARFFTRLVAGYFGLGSLADSIWSRVSDDPKARNDLTELVRDAMTEWLKKARGPGAEHLLVVFVDDLDRCSHENVLQVFEALKLYLNAPGFVFVLGYDVSAVTAAVTKAKQLTDVEAPARYLEKIIQVSYRIPPATPEEMESLLEGYCRTSRTAELLTRSERSLIIERNARNPRSIKRFLNTFIVEYEFDPDKESGDASLLIKILLFRTYFSDFFRLLAEGDDQDDPMAEFLCYERLRLMVKTGRVDPLDEALESFIKAHSVHWDAQGNGSAMLDELEKNLPEPFLLLVANRDFLSLIKGLVPEERKRLVGRVRRRKETLTMAPAYSAAEQASSAGAVPGSSFETGPSVSGPGGSPSLEVLWIDDQPENNRELVRWLGKSGARVTLAADGTQAEQLLRAGRFSAVISDVRRGAEHEAGLDDAERFRQESVYRGPLLFYTSRVTPSRRDRAEELDASITSNPDDVVRFLATSAATLDERNRETPQGK